MDLFKPSDKILDAICAEGETPLIQYEVYPFDSIVNMYNFQKLYVPGLCEKITSFYSAELKGDKRRLDLSGIFHLSSELIKNWADHTPEGHNLTTGLYLGKKGVSYGFFDDGDFFKNPEIKQQIENKLSFKKFHYPARGGTCKHGFDVNVYPYSDLLEVDSIKGIIYAVQFADNIIAPEGKHGSKSCHDLRKTRQNVAKTRN